MHSETGTVLMTGGAGSLGEVIARGFRDIGHKVLVTHARDEGSAPAEMHGIDAQGPDAALHRRWTEGVALAIEAD